MKHVFYLEPFIPGPSYVCTCCTFFDPPTFMVITGPAFLEAIALCKSLDGSLFEQPLAPDRYIITKCLKEMSKSVKEQLILIHKKRHGLSRNQNLFSISRWQISPRPGLVFATHCIERPLLDLNRFFNTWSVGWLRNFMAAVSVLAK